MNIFELSLFKEYIYYPTINIHFVSINLKIFIVAFYIILLPATCKYLVLISSILFLFIACQYNKLSHINFTIFKRLYYLFNICLIILFTCKQNTSYFIVSVPYQLKAIIFSTMGCIFQTKTSIIYLEIAQTIMRIYIILLHYLTLQKLILSTTKTEDLLRVNIGIISTFITQTTLLNEIRFSLLLSYKFAYSLEDEIKSLVMSFYLTRYDNAQDKTSVSTLKFASKLIYLGIKKGMEKVFFKTQTLHIREIELSKSQYWLI